MTFRHEAPERRKCERQSMLAQILIGMLFVIALFAVLDFVQANDDAVDRAEREFYRYSAVVRNP